MADWIHDILVDLEIYCGAKKYEDTRKMLTEARRIFREDSAKYADSDKDPLS